jgi:acylphosphatase
MEDNHTDIKRLHAIIRGHVQGVGFRYFVEENAIRLGLTGWVRNRWNRTVEVLVEGQREDVERLLKLLQRGPRAAIVSDVTSQWRPATGEFSGFMIRRTVG